MGSEETSPKNSLGTRSTEVKSEPMDVLPITINDDQLILSPKQTFEDAINQVESGFTAQKMPEVVLGGPEIHTKPEPDAEEILSQELYSSQIPVTVGENSNNTKKEKSQDNSSSDQISDSNNQEKPILCVVYLPFDWTLKQIKDFIEQECGPIIRCNLGKDTKLDIPGVISAEFETMEQCVKAKKILHKKTVDGMKLHAFHISDANTTTMSETDSETTSEPRAKKRKRQKSVEDAAIDVWDTDPTGLYGLKPEYLESLNVTPPITRWVHITNFRCDKWELKEALEMAGKVVICRVLHTAKKHAKVAYSHPLEAIQAISMLHNQKFYGAALQITMDHHSSHLTTMPNGLSNLGPGLGNFGKPLSDVVKHYERYLKGYNSSVDRTVFRKREDIKADFLNNEGLSASNSLRSGTYQTPGANISFNPTQFFSESPENLSTQNNPKSPVARSNSTDPELPKISSNSIKNDPESQNASSNSTHDPELQKVSPNSTHNGLESRNVSPNSSSHDPISQNVTSNSSEHALEIPNTQNVPESSNSTQNEPETRNVTSNSSPNNPELPKVWPTSTQNIPGQSNILPNQQNFWSNPSQTITATNVWSNQPQNTPRTWPNLSQNLGNSQFNQFQNLRPQHVAFRVQNASRNVCPQQPFHQNVPRQPMDLSAQFRQISDPQFRQATGPFGQGTGPQFQGTRLPFGQSTGLQFGQAVGSTRPLIGQGAGPQFRAIGPQFVQDARGSRMVFGQQTPVCRPAVSNVMNQVVAQMKPEHFLVQISNLPLDTSFMQLCEKMNHCGPVTSLRLTDPGCAIVQFSQRSCAEMCYQLYNNCSVNGNIIKVTIV